MTSDQDLIEYLRDRVCEGSVLLKVETDRTGDPAGYRIGVKVLGEDEHSEYFDADFREALKAALRCEDSIPSEDRVLCMWEWDEPPSEEIEALIACLGDDAAQLSDENPEDERAATMNEAAAMLGRLEKANRQLFAMGQKLYAATSASDASAQNTQGASTVDRASGASEDPGPDDKSRFCP